MVPTYKKIAPGTGNKILPIPRGEKIWTILPSEYGMSRIFQIAFLLKKKLSPVPARLLSTIADRGDETGLSLSLAINSPREKPIQVPGSVLSPHQQTKSEFSRKIKVKTRCSDIFFAFLLLFVRVCVLIVKGGK